MAKKILVKDPAFTEATSPVKLTSCELYSIIRQPGNLYSAVKVTVVDDKITNITIEPANQLIITRHNMLQQLVRWVRKQVEGK